MIINSEKRIFSEINSGCYMELLNIKFLGSQKNEKKQQKIKNCSNISQKLLK